jgi:hypothetical protein
MSDISPAASSVFDDVWEKYMAPIKPKILKRAVELSSADDASELSASHAFEAMKEYVPGRPTTVATTRLGWFNQNVTGFIGITAGLAIIFGILGIVPLLKENLPDKFAQYSAGFLEIAKIFAGALVGGAAAATAIKK